MFTGIVREVGRVVEVAGGEDGRTLLVDAPGTASSTSVGDSVAIDGVCLTAETIDGTGIRFHAVAETLARTTLGRLEAGAAVNVEPALRAGEPLGGHLVQGHVDDVGSVTSVTAEGDGLRVRIGAAPRGAALLRREGLDHRRRRVAHRRGAARGRLRRRARPAHPRRPRRSAALAPERRVNLEVDVLAKYVERLLVPR